MLKTAQELTAALNDAKRSSAPLELDPVTNFEEWIGVVSALAFFGLFSSGVVLFQLIRSNRPAFYLVAVVCLFAEVWLLTIVFAFTYNEYWGIDPTQRRVQATSSWFGFKKYSTQFDFDDVLSVGLSGHHNTGKSSQWWGYGMAVLTRDGVMHPIFPNLSKNFKDVWDCTEALAALLDAPLIKPVPLAQLEVRRGPDGPELCYKGQGRSHLSEPEPALEEAEKDEPQPKRRLEFAEDCGAARQIGCGMNGLILLAPLLLISLSSFLAGQIVISLVYGLLSLAIAYWMMNWILFPITRRVRYVDPAGIVGIQQFRQRGSPTESKRVVPPGAKVVLSESAGGSRMTWRLGLEKDGDSLWFFNFPASREQGEQDGRAIAHTLAIPFEINSEFER